MPNPVALPVEQSHDDGSEALDDPSASGNPVSFACEDGVETRMSRGRRPTPGRATAVGAVGRCGRWDECSRLDQRRAKTDEKIGSRPMGIGMAPPSVGLKVMLPSVMPLPLPRGCDAADFDPSEPPPMCTRRQRPISRRGRGRRCGCARSEHHRHARRPTAMCRRRECVRERHAGPWPRCRCGGCGMNSSAAQSMAPWSARLSTGLRGRCAPGPVVLFCLRTARELNGAHRGRVDRHGCGNGDVLRSAIVITGPLPCRRP